MWNWCDFQTSKFLVFNIKIYTSSFSRGGGIIFLLLKKYFFNYIFIFACPVVIKCDPKQPSMSFGSMLRWFAIDTDLDDLKMCLSKQFSLLWTKTLQFPTLRSCFHHSRFHFDLMKIQFLQKHEGPFTLLVLDNWMLVSSGVWCKLVNMIRPETQFYSADKSQFKKSLANWWDLPKGIRFGLANCTFLARDWYPFHQCWDTLFFWKQKIQKMPALYQSDLNGPQ